MHDRLSRHIASHPLLALWLDCPTQRRLLADQIADIALEAIMEPSREMLLAGAAGWSANGGTVIGARRQWRFMMSAVRPGTLPPMKRDRQGRIRIADEATSPEAQ